MSLPSNRAAVITGASSGIGRATAVRFAARGWDVVLGARRIERLEELAARLEGRFGQAAIAVPCDVRDEEQVTRLVSAAVERLGQLDAIVLNAGAGYYARVEDTPAADLRDLFETNVLGVHHGIRAAVPVMRAQGRGHIAVVGSVSGKRSWPYHGAYAATKFALQGLVQALRAELDGSGVTATLILPGTTTSEFFASAGGATAAPERMGPVQTPGTVARAILRSVEHPSAEITTTGYLRAAFALAEAFPLLPDVAARRHYRKSEVRRVKSEGQAPEGG